MESWERTALMKYIEYANGVELDEVLTAVEARYKILFPDWDVIYLALPKSNPNTRKQCLEAAIDFLRKYG